MKGGMERREGVGQKPECVCVYKDAYMCMPKSTLPSEHMRAR